MAKNKIIILLSSLTAILFVSVLVLLYLNFSKTPTPPTSTPVANIIPTETIIPTINQSPLITSIDSNWNLFSNPAKHFSVKFPKQANVAWGNCSQNNGSYSMAQAIVPLTVLTSPNSDLIVQSYFYDPTIQNINGQIIYTACTKTTTTYDLIQKRLEKRFTNPSGINIYPDGYDIKVKNVANDQELIAFIQSEYGSGCGLGKMTKVNDFTYDVQVSSDGRDMETTKCLINYMIAFKYSPTLKKAATWAMGQYPYFDSGTTQDFTKQIVNSFTFTP